MSIIPIKILAFSGSLRRDSYNKKLVQVAAEGARKIGAEVTLIDFRDYPMPFYDGDLPAGEEFPAAVSEFRRLMIEHHGFLIASPEYNASISPLLKNTLDWISRIRRDGEEPLLAFKTRVFAIGAASPGGTGGMRGAVDGLLTRRVPLVRPLPRGRTLRCRNAVPALRSGESGRSPAPGCSERGLATRSRATSHRLEAAR